MTRPSFSSSSAEGSRTVQGQRTSRRTTRVAALLRQQWAMAAPRHPRDVASPYVLHYTNSHPRQCSAGMATLVNHAFRNPAPKTRERTARAFGLGAALPPKHTWTPIRCPIRRPLAAWRGHVRVSASRCRHVSTSRDSASRRASENAARRKGDDECKRFSSSRALNLRY